MKTVCFLPNLIEKRNNSVVFSHFKFKKLKTRKWKYQRQRKIAHLHLGQLHFSLSGKHASPMPLLMKCIIIIIKISITVWHSSSIVYIWINFTLDAAITRDASCCILYRQEIGPSGENVHARPNDHHLLLLSKHTLAHASSDKWYTFLLPRWMCVSLGGDGKDLGIDFVNWSSAEREIVTPGRQGVCVWSPGVANHADYQGMLLFGFHALILKRDDKEKGIHAGIICLILGQRLGENEHLDFIKFALLPNWSVRLRNCHLNFDSCLGGPLCDRME